MWIPARSVFLFWSCLLTANATLRGKVEPEDAPKISEHPSDVVALRDDPAQLNCGADGATQVQWFHKGKLVRNKGGRTTSPLGVLFFLSVSHADTGVYWCEVSNSKGTTRSRNATLNIAYLREEFKVTPQDTGVAVGDTVVLECDPPAGLPRPEVQWLKEGQPVNVGSGRSRIRFADNSGNLVLQDVRSADQGSYVCKAENMVGIRETPAARVRVHSAPFFVVRPEDTTVVAYDNDVRLDCSAGGEPSPVIRWKRREGEPSQLSTGERVKVTEGASTTNRSSSSLEILNVVPEDEGDYVCEAENPADTISATARLTVHARPVFLVRPQDQKTSLNGVVNFQCLATGSPKPNIYWTKEGNQANLMFPNNTYGRIQIDNSGVLSIAGVKKEDEGFYVCSALSAIGSIMTKGQLEVTTLGDLPPPLIEVGPMNQTIPEGQPVTLPCEVSGVPTPEVQWHFNKDVLDEEDEDRITIDSQGTLTIQDLRFEDSGIYTCVASSESGETRQAAALNVASVHDPNVAFSRAPSPALLPSAPSKPRTMNVSDTSVTLAWDRPQDESMGGFHKIKAYTIEYFSADLQSGWVTVANRIGSEMYTVTSLKPETRYVFLIRAENALGTGRPSELSKVVKTLGSRTVGAPDHYLSRARSQLSITEVDLRSVKAVNSTSVSLEWSVAGDKDFIEGYYIRFKDMGGSTNKYNMVTAWGSKVSRYVLKDLKKFTKYEVFLVPFYKNVEGPPSNTRAATTLEDVPSAPVNEISVNVVNISSVWVQWKPPPSQHRNGVLLGYKLLLLGAIETMNQNVLTNTTHYVFNNLIEAMRYKLQVVPFTAMGDGPPSHFVDFSTDELSQPVAINSPFIHERWFILMLSFIFCFLLITIGILLYLCRRQHALKTTVSAVPVTKGADLNNCFATLTHPVNDNWTGINSYTENNKTVYENKLSALDGIDYCAEYALPDVKESEYAEVGQNLNTFGKRVVYQQQTPEPYASTTLVAPLDYASRTGNGVTIKSLAAARASVTRYSNTMGPQAPHELDNLLQANSTSVNSSSGDSASFGRRSGLSGGSHTECSSCAGVNHLEDECDEPIYNTVPDELDPFERNFSCQRQRIEKKLRIKNCNFNSLQHMDDSITVPSYSKSLCSPSTPAASRRSSAGTRAQL